MAKQRRPVKTPAKSVRRVKRPETSRKTNKVVVNKAKPRPPAEKREPAPAPDPPPPPPPRKPEFYEAVAIYERGVQALQKHDFAGAAGFFRTVLERYPD